MPGLQGENVVAALGSPVRRNKLSLKFLQRKETKRALDFSESQADEPKAVDSLEPECRWVCVPGLLAVRNIGLCHYAHRNTLQLIQLNDYEA